MEPTSLPELPPWQASLAGEYGAALEKACQRINLAGGWSARLVDIEGRRSLVVNVEAPLPALSLVAALSLSEGGWDALDFLPLGVPDLHSRLEAAGRPPLRIRLEAVDGATLKPWLDWCIRVSGMYTPD